MDYLVRKISRSKWEQQDGQGPYFVPSDAITACLRTSHGNKLSTWECDGTPAGVDSAVLTLAAAGDKIDKMDVLLLTKVEIASLGIEIERSPEKDNPAIQLRDTHIDLIGLDAHRLAALSRLIAHYVRADTNCRLYEKDKVRKILMAAYSAHKLDKDAIDEKLLNELIPASEKVSVATVGFTLTQQSKQAARDFIGSELQRRFPPDSGDLWHRDKYELPHYSLAKVELSPRLRGPGGPWPP